MARDPDLDGVSIYVPGDQVEHLSADQWWQLAGHVQLQAGAIFGLGLPSIEVRCIPARLDGICVQAVIDFRVEPRRGRRINVVYGPNETAVIRWAQARGIHQSLVVDASRRFLLKELDPSRCTAVILPGAHGARWPLESLDFMEAMKAAGVPMVTAIDGAPCTCTFPFPRMTRAGIAHGPGCEAY
jgi:hypothetical protein